MTTEIKLSYEEAVQKIFTRPPRLVFETTPAAWWCAEQGIPVTCKKIPYQLKSSEQFDPNANIMHELLMPLSLNPDFVLVFENEDDAVMFKLRWL